MPAIIKIEINSASAGRGFEDTKKSLHDLDDSARKAGGGFSALTGVVAGATAAITGAVLNMAAQGAAALAGFVGDSINQAGTFEAGMNQFAAAAGNMGQAELAEFQDLFLELGKKLPVSTKEVQDAATALVRGGIDPAIVAAGGLEDSLLFAAAANMDLKDAAELSTKQLGTFGSQITDTAGKVEFLKMSQDLLVKAANTSTADVDKLGDAMLQAGGAAQAAGLDYKDFVTTMGAIVGNFGSAAEAGTSFKNLLLRFIPATEKAKGVMQDLGIITEDGANKFYDATGQFLGMQNAAEVLKGALSGLSDAERTKAMATLFGNDAMGAANALMDLGADGLAKFSAQMGNANGVSEQAAATQQGFGFAMMNLQGSIEAAQIALGLKFLPLLTPLVTQVNDAVNAASGLAQALLGDADAAIALSPQMAALFIVIQQWIAQAQAAAAGATTMAAQFQGPLVMALGAGQMAFASIWAFIQTAMPGIQAVIQSALAIIVSLWQQNGGQLMAFWQQTWGTVQSIAQIGSQVIAAVFTAIAGFISAHSVEIVAMISGAWQAVQGVIQIVTGAIQGVLAIFLGLLTGDWTTAMAAISQSNETIWNGISDFLSGILGVIAAGFGTSLSEIKSTWESNFRAFSTIAGLLMNAAASVIGIGLGKISGAFSAIKGAIDGAIGAVKRFIDAASKIKVPSLVTPGSPTPLETGLRGITDAATQTASVFQSQLSPALAAVGQGIAQALFTGGQELLSSAASGGGGGNKASSAMLSAGADVWGRAMGGNTSNKNTTNNFTMNLKTNAKASTVASDFGMMKALAGVR